MFLCYYIINIPPLYHTATWVVTVLQPWSVSCNKTHSDEGGKDNNAVGQSPTGDASSCSPNSLKGPLASLPWGLFHASLPALLCLWPQLSLLCEIFPLTSTLPLLLATASDLPFSSFLLLLVDWVWDWTLIYSLMSPGLSHNISDQNSLTMALLARGGFLKYFLSTYQEIHWF